MPHRSTTIPLTIATAILLANAPAFATDPTTADCLGASDASLKLGNEHKLRAERSQLLVCAAPSCPADIRKECLRRVDEVNAQIPTVVFSARDASGSNLGTVKVSMDGELLAERLEGTPLSIDPGPHTFTFETAGQPPLTQKLVIVQGQKDRRESVAFGGGVGPSTAPAPALSTASDPFTTRDAAAGNDGLGTQKVLALVAGGAGVVGLGLGGAFGLVALSKKNDAQSACAGTCATQAAADRWSDAASAGNASTIAFVAGGVALAGAAVLWLTAPGAGTGQGTKVGVGPGGLQVKGVW